MKEEVNKFPLPIQYAYRRLHGGSCMGLQPPQLSCPYPTKIQWRIMLTNIHINNRKYGVSIPKKLIVLRGIKMA